MQSRKKSERASGIVRPTVFAVSLALTTGTGLASELEIAQRPAALGDSSVPGNLFLVPSIEWPTMNSIANIGTYNPGTEYVGYFNSGKCYEYQNSTTTASEDRHWSPSSAANNFTCAGGNEWSGNFLNWAATQTIDPFRLALMGGYRYRDTPEETWLQKARHDGQGNQYPNRVVSDRDVIVGATPFEADQIEIEIDGRSSNSLRSSMRFWVDGWHDDSEAEYVPEETGSSFATRLVADVRVAVCTGNVFIDEDRCTEYDNGNYKPEGLIQDFARMDNPEGVLRYSLFTYLNDDARQRDGGVMRSHKKYVGPEMLDPATGEVVSNPNSEWDPDTGVLETNPDPDLATATSEEFDVTIERSGIINYIGAAGQTNTNSYKSTDPLSELYYAASRYLRNLGPVEAYHQLPGNTGVDTQQALDDFPVVTEWDDPLEQYYCAPNAGITIADVFTHRDKNLPGNESGPRGDEPSYWSELAADAEDTGLNVRERTNQIGNLEGWGNIGDSVFTGRDNSAYIAGLAYDMHTRDQRDLPGTQTMSTYTVDVVENQELEPPENNMLYLAAKYGGFRVPAGFDPDERDDPLEQEWWHRDGEVASVPGDTTQFDRPENYFLANEARRMEEGLREAFERIASEESGSAAAVAANTTEASSDSLLYQAQYESGTWTGEILAMRFDGDGNVDPTDVAWHGSQGIPEPGQRNVFTINDNGAGSRIPNTAPLTGLTANQRAHLNDDADLAAYLLLGEQEEEARNGGALRDRMGTVLGTIVSSAPEVTRGGNFGYSILPDDQGSNYGEFLREKRERDEMLYVGANDGMLHAFDATEDGGNLVFSFAPDAVFEGLPQLAEPGYDHRKYVDGQVRVADAYHASRGWMKALLGSTGGGGRSVFALDVTEAATGGFGEDNVLWEISGDDEPRLGHVLADMQIVRMNNGEFAAVFGNGYNSDSREASLFIVPLHDPDNLIVLETGAGGSNNPNGLGGVTTVDIRGNGIVDWIYGGDLHGNMWRFDVTGESTASWQGDVLLEARGPNGETQPITAAPRVTPHSQQGVNMNVLFGTGRDFVRGDSIPSPDPDVQSFYAIKDSGPGQGLVRRIDLENEGVRQTIETQTLGNDPTRIMSDNQVAADDHGWFIDLVYQGQNEGERVTESAALVGDRVFFLTQIPQGELCGGGGRSWLMEMDAESGGLTQTALHEASTDIGGIGFDQLATGLGGLRGEGTVTFHPSLSDTTIEEVEVEDERSSRAGRLSWEELQ